MSTSANVMRLAAQELNAEDKIKVIDSANLSNRNRTSGCGSSNYGTAWKEDEQIRLYHI